MKINTITTDLSNKKYLSETGFKTVEETDEYVPLNLIRIYPDYTYQSIIGFGGAFTDSAAHTFSKMSAEKQSEVIKAYFDNSEGIGYNFGRTHINSNDFSTEMYTYVEEGDGKLETFSIERDRRAIIPMIKAAQKYADIKLFASPWSPPAFMKSNGEMRNGGKLLPEYFDAWAEYYKRYIEEYKKCGIDIWGVTVQNEPMAAQPWESCRYSSFEEKEFVKNYLGKKLEGMNVKIFCWDHNKHMLCEAASEAFEDPEASKYIDGLACHWYSGDHFEEIKMVKQRYPDKLIIFSEGCKASKTLGLKTKAESLEFAECYAHEIIGDLSSGMSAFTDWNLVLDMKNGPYHDRGDYYCDAPVILDPDNDKVYYEGSYYYIGHFSKYIKEGAVILGTSRYTENLETVSARNTDGSIVCVIMNKSDEAQKANVKCGRIVEALSISPHSIVTIVIKEN